MPSSKDWMNNNLTIAAHPIKTQRKGKWWESYDLIINVSDYMDVELNTRIAYHGIAVYWFPMGESYGIPLENVYGAISVLWYAESNNLRVLLHGISGRNRSIMVTDCYYYLKIGRHRKDDASDVLYGKNKSNKLVLNINDNQLPGIYRMELFLEKCRNLLTEPEVADGAPVDWLKKETFR
jgi:hypothetical protein